MPPRNFQWSRPWELQAPAIPITDELWYVGNLDVSCHVVKTPEGAILLDTAFANTTYLLVDSLHRAGVRSDDVKLIVHSHGHEDHCGGTRRMKAFTGAEVLLGEADVETVELGTPWTCAEYTYGIPHFETFTVDRALKHGDTIQLGGVTITCHHTPGHTAGCMSYTFPIRVEGEERTVGLFGGPGLWTMLDEHIELQGYPEAREDFARSLDYLAGLAVEVWLGAHPGQCDTFEKAERLARGESPNPFIDPKGWEAFIVGLKENYRRAFD